MQVDSGRLRGWWSAINKIDYTSPLIGEDRANPNTGHYLLKSSQSESLAICDVMLRRKDKGKYRFVGDDGVVLERPL